MPEHRSHEVSYQEENLVYQQSTFLGPGREEREIAEGGHGTWLPHGTRLVPQGQTQ